MEDKTCESCGRMIVKAFPETRLCYLCAMKDLYYKGTSSDE